MDGRWHPQADGSRYRVVTEADALIVEHSTNRNDGEESVVTDYRVDAPPRASPEFLPMWRFHQTSEASLFTRIWMCTLATAQGRTTMKPGWLSESEAGGKEDRRVPSRDDLEQLLGERFGMLALRLPVASSVVRDAAHQRGSAPGRPSSTTNEARVAIGLPGRLT